MNSDSSNAHGCQPSASSTPERIHNRPALGKIRYRVGTFGTFRQSMVEKIASNPALRNWTTRAIDDFGIALLDMWAYVGDVLTFYQERIANEAYLRTATQLASVLRFASMLDYRPSPGLAAQTYFAFTVEAGKRVQVPERLKVQSVPEPGETPQKFETVESIEARAEWNEIRLRREEPQAINSGLTELYIEDLDTGLEPGDEILILGNDRKTSSASTCWEFRVLETVDALPEMGNTRVTWKDDLGEDLGTAGTTAGPEVYALQRRARLYGYNAPDWISMPEEVKRAYAKRAGDEDDWENDEWPLFDIAGHTIDIEGIHPKLLPDSWIVFLDSSNAPPLLGKVEEVSSLSLTDFMLPSQVTRVKLDASIPTDFTRRNTVAFIESVEIPIASRPITDDVPKDTKTIAFDRDVDGLAKGHRIIIGQTTADGTATAEAAVVESADAPNGHTEIALQEPLKNSYDPQNARVFANIVRATHGVTIEDEILGDGDASATLQSFALQKTPVTFLSDAQARHGAANTLELRVDGVKWSEVPTLCGRRPEERIFTTAIDAEGAMSVRLGDGVTGSRLPSGRGNVTGRYRQGIGPDGNVGADSLTTLLDRLLGLKGVTNPTPATGGTGSESRVATRRNAPNTVRTFERVVSLLDFEDAAREAAGIAKARATSGWTGQEECVHLTVAGDSGRPLSNGLKDLRAYLDDRRDPNRRLEITEYSAIDIQVDALIQPDPAHDEKAVKEAAVGALLAHFAFDNRDLGQAVHLSDLYLVLEDVPGVEAVRIRALRHATSSEDLNWHLTIHPPELAALRREDIEIKTGKVQS
jgi:hypothetical protein